MSERRSAATTGTKKKSAMRGERGRRRRAGPRSRAQLRSVSLPVRASQPAALLEHPVGVAVERGERLASSVALAAHRGLRVARDAARDALPLGELRRRAHVRELRAEGARLRVARERGVVPRRAARREIAREAVERDLLRGLREERDPAPRRPPCAASARTSARLAPPASETPGRRRRRSPGSGAVAQCGCERRRQPRARTRPGSTGR